MGATDMARATTKADTLLRSSVRVVNVGLEGFARELESQGVPVVHVEWVPPAGGKHALIRALSLLAMRHEDKIAGANQEGVRRMSSGEPVLADVRPAEEVIQGLGDRVILHAGPPIAWDRMCGPLQGAVAGAIVYEGWASDLGTAMELAASGEIRFHPNHHFDAVGPMTGITTRSMPVFVVENRSFGNRAYCTINEGLGKVMRFGGNDEEVLERLRWLRDDFGPALARALRQAGGIELSPIIARGLTMGDEMHQRNVACSALALRALAAPLARAVADRETVAAALEFISGNDQFFLNIAMAMGKAIMDPVRNIEGCSIVTAMCRNGTEFGIRLSGTGDAWFTAPVEMPQGLYFPGYSQADANPDMGDSAIIETIGLGGFAMAASPAVVGFVGAGTVEDALDYTRTMSEVAVSRNPRWAIPALDMAGTPFGIDVRRVLESGITPAINTGIAHRRPGVGQVGAGVVRAPLACFEKALLAFADAMGIE